MLDDKDKMIVSTLNDIKISLELLLHQINTVRQQYKLVIIHL